VAFPACKHDDQADSTSQALDWGKLNTHTYALSSTTGNKTYGNGFGCPMITASFNAMKMSRSLQSRRGPGGPIIWTDLGWIDYDPQN
jgi:hypothetical protein